MTNRQASTINKILNLLVHSHTDEKAVNQQVVNKFQQKITRDLEIRQKREEEKKRWEEEEEKRLQQIAQHLQRQFYRKHFKDATRLAATQYKQGFEQARAKRTGSNKEPLVTYSNEKDPLGITNAILKSKKLGIAHDVIKEYKSNIDETIAPLTAVLKAEWNTSFEENKANLQQMKDTALQRKAVRERNFQEAAIKHQQKMLNLQQQTMEMEAKLQRNIERMQREYAQHPRGAGPNTTHPQIYY